MLIRKLDPNADFAITRELHDWAADDLMLEQDRCVDTEMVIDFFNAAPPRNRPRHLVTLWAVYRPNPYRDCKVVIRLSR